MECLCPCGTHVEHDLLNRSTRNQHTNPPSATLFLTGRGSRWEKVNQSIRLRIGSPVCNPRKAPPANDITGAHQVAYSDGASCHLRSGRSVHRQPVISSGGRFGAFDERSFGDPHGWDLSVVSIPMSRIARPGETPAMRRMTTTTVSPPVMPSSVERLKMTQPCMVTHC